MNKIILISFLFISLDLCSAQTLNKILVQDAKQDINQLISTIESVHYNPFHKIDKHTILEKKDSLFLNWKKDSISYREFTKSGMWITSLMSNGHTSFDWQNPLLFPELISSSFLSGKTSLKFSFTVFLRYPKILNKKTSQNPFTKSIIRWYKSSILFKGNVSNLSNGS